MADGVLIKSRNVILTMDMAEKFVEEKAKKNLTLNKWKQLRNL